MNGSSSFTELSSGAIGFGVETLLVRLQFGNLRQEAFAILDDLRAKVPDNENWRFRFHRIDSRGWKAIEDRENNRIIFEPKSLEPDLEKIQQESQEDRALHERFMRMYLWTGKAFDSKKLDSEYYPSWHEALKEARTLAEILETTSTIDLSKLYVGSVVKAAAIFLRDHSNEMTEDDALWCADTVIQAVISNPHSDDTFGKDESDFDGASSAASVLSTLFDLTNSEEDKRSIKLWIATAVTHRNANVRAWAANGIRENLWQRDRDFAQVCLFGAIEFARLQAEHSPRRRRSTFLQNTDEENAAANFNSWINDFRQLLANEGISLTASDMTNLQFQTHSPWYMLTPCLMVPDGSTDPIHVALLSRMLNLFFATGESTQEREASGLMTIFGFTLN